MTFERIPKPGETGSYEIHIPDNREHVVLRTESWGDGSQLRWNELVMSPPTAYRMFKQGLMAVCAMYPELAAHVDDPDEDPPEG